MNTQDAQQCFTRTIEREMTAEDRDTHLDGCIGCGLCGNNCAWYLGTNNPQYHPMIRANMLRDIYRGKTVLTEHLDEMSEAFFKGCTMCGRCSLACPQGVSNRRIIQLGRHALSNMGIAPDIINQIHENARSSGHSFGMTFDESIGQAIKLAKTLGREIPIDKTGAEYLLGCSAIVNSRFPEMIAETIRLLDTIGISYTMSSRTIDTGTEAMTTVGNLDLGRQFVENVAKEAHRLGCKKVLLGECGCDLRIYMIEAGEILNHFGIQPVYIDALLLDKAKSGQLPLAKLDLKVTFHDPCWANRLTGYYDEARELLKLCGAKIVEMTPNREMNYCCNGGAGSMRVFPSTDEETNLRRQVSRIKASQLEMTGVDTVIAPCTTCFLSLKDTLAQFELPMKARMLSDVVLEAMDKAATKVAVGGER